MSECPEPGDCCPECQRGDVQELTYRTLRCLYCLKTWDILKDTRK